MKKNTSGKWSLLTMFVKKYIINNNFIYFWAKQAKACDAKL